MHLRLFTRLPIYRYLLNIITPQSSTGPAHGEKFITTRDFIQSLWFLLSFWYLCMKKYGFPNFYIFPCILDI
jgi:hypothetical protein